MRARRRPRPPVSRKATTTALVAAAITLTTVGVATGTPTATPAGTTPAPSPSTGAADLVVTTFAGNGEPESTGDGGPAVQAAVVGPDAVAVGPDGVVYVADANRTIRAVAPDGTISPSAGVGVSGFLGDGGPASDAAFAVSELVLGGGGMATGPDGTLYIADQENHRIRAIGPDGVVRTVAGSGPSVTDATASQGLNGGYAGDGGPATSARLNAPTDVAVAPDGTLYIADGYNNRLCAVAPDGTISTFAGADSGHDEIEAGQRATEGFVEPESVAVGPDGTVYVGERDQERVLAITPDAGVVSVVAGYGAMDQLNLSNITDVAVGPNQHLYILENNLSGAMGSGRLHVVDLATGATVGTYGDGESVADGLPADQAAFGVPHAVTVDADGMVYVADGAFNRVWRIGPPAGVGPGGSTPFAGGPIATFAGSGERMPDEAAMAGEDLDDDGGWLAGGVRLPEARLAGPRSVAVAPDGTVYISDSFQHRVRAVAPGSDRARTVAGTGHAGSEEEYGSATEAWLYRPAGIDVGPDGMLYIADKFNDRVRLVDVEENSVRTVAEDGLAAPGDVAVTDDGTLYVADTNNNRLCRVDPGDDTCELVLGGTDTEAPADEAGGPARDATLVQPQTVEIGPDGAVYIADTGNARVRRFDPEAGTVSIVAGNGTVGAAGDGSSALGAQLAVPVGLEVAADGTVYIGDVGTQTVRAVDPETGLISTIAGAMVESVEEYSAARAFSGEVLSDDWGATGAFAGDGGPAAEAQLNWPQSLALDASGETLYVADAGNNRVRVLGADGLDARSSISPRVWVLGGAAMLGVGTAAAWIVVLRRRRAPE